MESSRYMTGPHGVLVNRAINRKDIYETHIGVPAGMIGNPRTAVYGAYHHISVCDGLTGVLKKIEEYGFEIVNIVGPICEDCDRLTDKPRKLAIIVHSEEYGDFIITHDVGAYSIAMPGNYNMWTRLAAYVLMMDGSLKKIQHAETIEILLDRTKGL